jgi:hypothetical protein
MAVVLQTAMPIRRQGYRAALRAKKASMLA